MPSHARRAKTGLNRPRGDLIERVAGHRIRQLAWRLGIRTAKLDRRRRAAARCSRRMRRAAADRSSNPQPGWLKVCVPSSDPVPPGVMPSDSRPSG
jgi:hypothetical protein